MLLRPSRSDLTSEPASTMPASSLSSMKYSWRALRFWAMSRCGAASLAAMTGLPTARGREDCGRRRGLAGRGHRALGDQAGEAHRLLDPALRAVGDLAQRQARLGRAQAEQARGVLHRTGARLDEQREVQRHEQIVELGDALEVAPG